MFSLIKSNFDDQKLCIKFALKTHEIAPKFQNFSGVGGRLESRSWWGYSHPRHPGKSVIPLQYDRQAATEN